MNYFPDCHYVLGLWSYLKRGGGQKISKVIKISSLDLGFRYKLSYPD
jgi:hypothetical protein